MSMPTSVEPVRGARKHARLVASEIEHMECFALQLGLLKPMIMSTYSLTDGPVLYVRIRARNGMEGWGEAAANIVMSGETLPGMAAAFDSFVTPQLLGQPALDRPALMARLQGGVYANGGLLAAVDMALLDLCGKILDVPAVELLGGARRREVHILRLVGGSGDMQRDVSEAIVMREQGFRAFKLKVGVASLDQEIETVRQLRRELGADALIGADANMGWTPRQALAFLRGTADSQLAFLEQPLPAGKIGHLRDVAKHTATPLAIDESLHDAGDLLAHAQAEAIGGASLKSIKLGGVGAVVAMANLAHALGLSVNIAMMMESGLANAAMVHAASAADAVEWGLSLGQLWLSRSPVAGVDIKDGMALCPQGPGLGIEVDAQRLEAFRV